MTFPGIPVPNGLHHATEISKMALDLLAKVGTCQAHCPFWSLIFFEQKQRQTLKWLFTHHPSENCFWSQMKAMANIRFFHSSALALILPQLKDITYFRVSQNWYAGMWFITDYT